MSFSKTLIIWYIILAGSSHISKKCDYFNNESMFLMTWSVK